MVFGARRRSSLWRGCALSALFVTVPVWAQAGAQDARRLHGEVRDPLGALVAGARVELVQKEQVVATTTSGPDGGFALPLPGSGRYRVRVSAPEFQTATTASSYFSGKGTAPLEVTLATETLTQEVTVTTTGTPTPEAQTGAAVTVLPSEQFALRTEVQEPLRLVPGPAAGAERRDWRDDESLHPRRQLGREQGSDRRRARECDRWRGGVQQLHDGRRELDRGAA